MRKAIVFATAALLMASCKTVKETVEVPVYVHDTVRNEHVEYIYKHDTVTNTVQTIVREANERDSLLLAQLGLQLGDYEHTVLVLRDQLEQKQSQIESLRQDSSYSHGETPVVVTQTETIEVKKPLGWWQKLFMGIGVLAVLAGVGAIAWKVVRKMKTPAA